MLNFLKKDIQWFDIVISCYVRVRVQTYVRGYIKIRHGVFKLQKSSLRLVEVL